MHYKNVIVLTITLHRLRLDDILALIIDHLKLEKGIVLNINSKEKLVIAFLLTYIGNIS
jgi:hypothetical protein